MDKFQKQPGEELDYDIDGKDWFEFAPGDDIQSVEITITSLFEEAPTLILGPSLHPDYQLLNVNPTSFKVWIGGGTNNVDYQVNCLITTEQDRKVEHEFMIKVRDK